MLLSEFIRKLTNKLTKSGDGEILIRGENGIINDIGIINTDFDYDTGTFYIINVDLDSIY